METELTRIVNALPGLVWTAGLDGHLDFVNQRWCEYTGLRAEDAYGSGWLRVVHPDDRAQLLENWQAMLAAGRPYEMEARLRRFDGEYRLFVLCPSPMTDRSGNIEKWCGLNTEIEERQRAEAAGRRHWWLQSSTREDHFRSIADSIPALVALLTPAGGVELVNSQTLEYFGATLEELKGRAHADTIHPDDLADVLAVSRGPRVDAGHPYDFEARLRRADGVYRWFHARVFPLRDRDGRFVLWYMLQTDIDDRKQAQNALRAHWWLWSPEREDQFRSIVDSIWPHAALITPTGKLTYASRKALEYYGATLSQMQGLDMAETCHPDDLPAINAAWLLSLETGEPHEIEQRVRGGDGTYRWFHIRALPIRDAEGRIACFYAMQTDIDDRKQAEALLAGEKRLLEMVASGQPLAEILEALCRLYESRTAGARCSVALVNPSGSHLELCVAPSLPVSLIAAINDRPVNLDSDPCATAIRLNTQIIAADLAAEARWTESGWSKTALEHGVRSCWSTPIRSTADKIVGAFAFYDSEPRTPTSQHQDLIQQFVHIASIAIERAQGDAALKRSEAFLSEAQRLSSTGGFSWRVATNEITWSAEVYRIFQIEQSGPLTPEVTDSRVHPDDLPMLYERVNRARTDGKDFEFDYRLVMPDNTIKYLHTVFHGIQSQDGDVEFVGAIQDVTERRRSEEALNSLRSELAHMSRVTSLGALTASIAHEVNQPLSGIVTNASTCLRMLAADPPNVEGALETARRTIRDGNRASDVIARLRMLFAKKNSVWEAVDLNEAAREVISLALRELRGGQVILRSEFAEDLPPVIGDRVQLQQVIMNLLLNASDAMSKLIDRPRLLTIRTEREDSSHVNLSVKDAGVGFDPQSADRLFEAFYTTKSNGMGIGLSVSRSIVEHHRGRLWATPNDGPGVTFSFSLPIGRDRASDADSQAAVQPGATYTTEHVMSTQ
jgi:PAS domain S-box-containing protein